MASETRPKECAISIHSRTWQLLVFPVSITITQGRVRVLCAVLKTTTMRVPGTYIDSILGQRRQHKWTSTDGTAPGLTAVTQPDTISNLSDFYVIRNHSHLHPWSSLTRESKSPHRVLGISAVSGHQQTFSFFARRQSLWAIHLAYSPNAPLSVS
jgi:hypothetical protein